MNDTFSVPEFCPDVPNKQDVAHGHQEKRNHKADDKRVLGVHVEHMIVHIRNAYSDVVLENQALFRMAYHGLVML